jgi:multiple sugar transport system permease protein
MSIRKKSDYQRLKNFILYTILLIGILIVIYPFFILVLNSFKRGIEIVNYPRKLPTEISLYGYKSVFKDMNLLMLFKNSIFVSFTGAALCCLFNSMCGYALAKIRFAGREIMFRMILSTMMLPAILLLVPTYILMDKIGWVDTYRVLIIIGMISAYNIFLFRQFMIQIPDEFVEAAKIDGANHIFIYSRIIMPMSIPVTVSVGILDFVARWNDIFNPLLYLKSEKLYTLQLGLWKYSSQIANKFLEQRYAAMTLITIPVLILYIFLQKYFIRAFAITGLK